MGNVLRGDDAFGVEVARALSAKMGQTGEARQNDALLDIIETGIGGISLVQELMKGYGCLLLIDAVDQSELSPGELVWQSLKVADLDQWTPRARDSFLADVHYANPNRALILAKALDVLPEEVYLLGCQAARDAFEVGMSPQVAAAVPRAVARLKAFFEARGLERPTFDGDGHPA